MGSCGCGDTSPDFQFPGPDGLTYAVHIYPSCHYCSTPVGVDIYRFGPEGAADWTEGAPVLPFMSYGDDERPNDGIASIPVLDPEHLAIADDDDEDASEIREEDLRLALPHAVWATLNDWSRARQSTEESQ